MQTAVHNLLVATLSRLPLLKPRQCEELPRLLAEFPSPRGLAKELVRRGWLTAYQVNQIFLGQADDLLIGNFICLNKIGEGGMGQVFKAWQRPLERLVALKVLRRECVGNSKAVQRFQREMRAVGQLRHPNIIHAYDADETNGTLSIAMEYIEGIDLARMVKRQGPLAVEPALDFIRQTALGLQHAHENGLVHRDIKPANLLVAKAGKPPYGTVKVLDLGLARLADPGEAKLTILGTVMGTPDFIAPEQALNPHTCDIRADLYSLGCTLYYLLTGRIPFPRGGVAEKLLQHQTHEPEPVESVRRNRLMTDAAKTGRRPDERDFAVPPAVESLVRALMAKRPEDRFQTPAELVAAIDCVVGQLTADPMSATYTSFATNPNIDLAPISFLETPRPPSSLWRSLVGGSRPDEIVKFEKSRIKNATGARWWFAAVGGAILAGATLVALFDRGHGSHADEVSTKVEQRKSK